MCVVAFAWAAHPQWQLVAAGNRDEYHARASAPLARWDDGSGIIGGRDLVSGGSWMGVGELGRFAVVTNIRNPDGPDDSKLSRGALVSDWLGQGIAPQQPDRFNPFNLVMIGGSSAALVTNRPVTQETALSPGLHGLSNAIPAEHWPRKDRLMAQLRGWLDADGHDPLSLLTRLRDDHVADRDSYPLFIESPVYGTRCSTIVVVDASGAGLIVERRFDVSGAATGETAIRFRWPAFSRA